MANHPNEQDAVEQVVGRLLMHNTALAVRVARLEAELADARRQAEEKRDGA